MEEAVQISAKGFVGQEQSNRVLELIQGHRQLSRSHDPFSEVGDKPRRYRIAS